VTNPEPAAEQRQTSSDTQQTMADTEQTRADSDQTAADMEQSASDSDQAAADQDQAASDRDLAGGGDPENHAATLDMRQEGARRRRSGAVHRLEAAAARDAVAAARDVAAAARDQAAADLDRHLEQRELATDNGDSPLGSRSLSAVESRERSAANRVSAAEARVRAAVERGRAADDRAQAARDRAEAAREREALCAELATSELDALTGTRARGAGLADLENEIDRARRDKGLLAVAYIDIVGLKAVNDTQGHAAGDALLKDSVEAIRDHLRSYDAIIRLGGDEFLCVVSGASASNLRQRFDRIEAALQAKLKRPGIKVGVASLAPDDTASALVDRADAAIPQKSMRTP
jgi:diguanylate cyclase (GGDEF)-like protein